MIDGELDAEMIILYFDTLKFSQAPKYEELVIEALLAYIDDAALRTAYNALRASRDKQSIDKYN